MFFNLTDIKIAALSPYLTIKEKEIAIEIVRLQPIAFLYFCKELKNDKDVVLELVKTDGLMFREIPDILKNNNDIILEAINQTEEAFMFLPKKLLGDNNFNFEKIKNFLYEEKIKKEIVISNDNLSLKSAKPLPSGVGCKDYKFWHKI